MSEKANILLVDDQPAKLLTYEVMLADLGENLIKAGSAKQALRLLLKHDIAVVLTDVSMPEMSGFELADTIRQHPRFQKVAIIFVSALHLTDQDRLRGYAHGAVDYVSVPVVPEVLCAKVRVFVELHRKTRQLERMNQELERRVEERTAALRSSEQFAAMGRMAGTIAHEINNPLEAIVNALFLLYNQPSLDEEARRYASIANQELLRLSHIARQTLGFYRESQQAVPVSLAALVDEVLELQSSLLTLNKISLRKRYRTQKTILGFPAELKQVFVNLIGNAIQAMMEGGCLAVSVTENTDCKMQRKGVRVYISDTGPGINPEDAERIFEPFFTTKCEKGTGLGLWISKGIVQKYEGTIRARTLRLAEGCATCFSVFLPRLQSLDSVQESRNTRAG